MHPRESNFVFLTGGPKTVANFVFTLNLAVLHADALVAFIHVSFPNSQGLAGHLVSTADIAGTGDLKVLSTGASVATSVARLVEGFSSSVLDAIVCAQAVGAVVRNKVSSICA